MPAIPKDSSGNILYPGNNNTPQPITNASSSTKDNLKNSDPNDPRKVISRNSDGNSYLEILPWKDEDVSAYIFFRKFSYERARQSEKIIDGQLLPRDNTTGDKTEYKGSIILPLTQPINMGYQVNWDSFDNPLNATNFAKSATIAAKSVLGSVISAAGVTPPGAAVVGLAALEASEPYQDYLINAGSTELEKVANLDSELVLQGIGLRKHTFEFLLTPRNKKESETILKIIKEFKIAQAPAKGDLMGLEYPYEFAIYFMDGRPGREGQPLQIPSIPDCACININVTYNPQLVRFNEDQTAIQYRLSLQFVEHQTLTRDDIQEGNF